MDQIIIKNLETFGYHGVFQEEAFLGQKFIVDAVLYVDIRNAGKTDDLSFSLDYGEACQVIVKHVQAKRYQLIESLAEHLAEELLLTFEQLQKVDITIKKPWAPVKVSVETVAVSITRSWHEAYLSIGSNMGDREGYLDFAIDELNELVDTKVIAVSDYIETEPYGDVEQDMFLNGVLKVHTLQTPHELLDTIHEIEKAAHRERLVHWGPRTLDLDILFYDHDIIMDEDLQIPHIDMHNRQFVLEPMNGIAPFYIHPIYHKTIRQMLNELNGE